MIGSAIAIAGAITAASAGDLQTRFSQLSCAIVQITSDSTSGTGFVIDNEGHVATAAHVLFERHWFANGNKLSVSPVQLKNVTITWPTGERTAVSPKDPDVTDVANASFDWAVVSTGHRTKCFIPVNKPRHAIGEHVIAIGHPNGNVTPVLYEGFVSAVHVHWPVPLGPVENQKDAGARASYTVMRIQMPITPGASGSPIINDRGEAIGVISEVPVIVGSDVSQIAALTRRPEGYNSGILLSGIDVSKVLGELSALVLDYQAAGSAFAVPTDYLTVHR